jgi:hemerythrin-like domain-containing protein
LSSVAGGLASDSDCLDTGIVLAKARPAAFRVEEEMLLPHFATAGGADMPVVARVLIEHAEIRLRALRLQGAASSAALLNELGELLAQHVRLEEHELFPAIEASLDDAELRRLAADVAAAEGRHD